MILNPRLIFLSRMTGHLTAANSEDKNKRTELRKAIANTLDNDIEIQNHIRAFAHEASNIFSYETIDQENQAELMELSKDKLLSGVNASNLTVYRRETPFQPSKEPAPIPAWKTGGAIKETKGPFLNKDGRYFWFDFYQRADLLPVFLPAWNSTIPAIYLDFSPESLNKFKNSIPPRLLTKWTFPLESGSIWINGKLFDQKDTPQNWYVGLEISGGELEITGRPEVLAGKLKKITHQNLIRFKLRPIQNKAPSQNNVFGQDARAASINLPSEFDFEISGNKLKITHLADASWKLYDQDIKFTWDAQKIPEFSVLTNRMIIYYKPSVSTFSTQNQLSTFCKIQGSSSIEIAGWSLPMAEISDKTFIPQARNSGALALKCQGETLFASWPGLQNDKIKLKHPWIIAETGKIEIRDNQASSLNARQYYSLWDYGEKNYQSNIELNYSDRFLFNYFASSDGKEMIDVHPKLKCNFDKPVSTDGLPLEIKSANIRLILFNIEKETRIQIEEDNLLGERFAAEEPVYPISFALENALLTTTPVHGLLITGQLLNENTISKGQLLLTFGLSDLTPTLPDPYAAKTERLDRIIHSNTVILNTNVQSFNPASIQEKINLILTINIKWQFNAQGTISIPSEFSFHLGLIEAKSFSATANSCGYRFIPFNEEQHPLIEKWKKNCTRYIPATITATVSVNTTNEDYNIEAQWNNLSSSIEYELFTLLDVSGKEDLLGITMHCSNTLSEFFIGDITPNGATSNTKLIDAPSFPIQIQDLNLTAKADQLQVYYLPQISWEPIINNSDQDSDGNPPLGKVIFPNDGAPSRIGRLGPDFTRIAPSVLAGNLIQYFNTSSREYIWSMFTLPWGLWAVAVLSKKGISFSGAEIEIVQPEFEADLKGGHQIRLKGRELQKGSSSFPGYSGQNRNVLNELGKTPTTWVNSSSLNIKSSILGESVTNIYNEEFFNLENNKPTILPVGVPLEQIDLSGYGASTFSHWQDPNGKVASVSQAKFDIWLGRTAEEIIQVKSIVYPYGFSVVRTVSIFRRENGEIYRSDSGWQAESDGTFNFTYINPKGATIKTPYTIYPGLFKGIFNIKNIIESRDIPIYHSPVNQQNVEPELKLQPIYFDGDIKIEGVTQGGMEDLVPSKKIVGYVQITPGGPNARILTIQEFDSFLRQTKTYLKAKIDSTISLAGTEQLMRTKELEFQNTLDNNNKAIAVAGIRGSVLLPREGAWNVVQHHHGTGEIRLVNSNAGIPVIREGAMTNDQFPTTAGFSLKIADPSSLFKIYDDTLHYAFLQDTGTQKMLFSRPKYTPGKKFVDLEKNATYFTDALTLINSSNIFPNLNDAFPVDLGDRALDIIKEGFRFLSPKPDKKLKTENRTITLVDLEDFKIYIEYLSDDLDYSFDALTQGSANWLSKLAGISLVVDLGPFHPLLTIKSGLNAGKGAIPTFEKPKLEFGPELKPVVEILQFLQKLSGGSDYTEQGLKIAFSNSANSWNYSFSAEQSFPSIKFPPSPAFDEATIPFKVEAKMGVGVYFNEMINLTSDPKQFIPSVGAFFEFEGRAYIMVASIGVGSIYAIGGTSLKVYGDNKKGIGLSLSLDFGAQVTVSLPVIGHASVLFMVSTSLDINKDKIIISAMILFRGECEILGGLVAIMIQIEARGAYEAGSGTNQLGYSETYVEAEVTFALNLTICWIIHLDFEKSFRERRRIN